MPRSLERDKFYERENIGPNVFSKVLRMRNWVRLMRPFAMSSRILYIKNIPKVIFKISPGESWMVSFIESK